MQKNRRNDGRSSEVRIADRGDSQVRDVLLRSGKTTVATVAPATPLLEALAVMEERDEGALVVTEGHRVVGILSERDCARKVLLEERSPGRTTVEQIMTRPVFSVTANKSVRECLEMMVRRGIRHLPVLFGNYLVGCVSLRDLVTSLFPETPPQQSSKSRARDRSCRSSA